jgi:NhaP-type Na+/H+ or K+/H+ antiporter
LFAFFHFFPPNMPTLAVSELNITIAVLGGFTFLFGIISVLVKGRWFLGEALPAMVVGIALGPVAARFLDNTRWGPGSLTEDEKSAITLGFMRVMISIQLLIAGYQVSFLPIQPIRIFLVFRSPSA